MGNTYASLQYHFVFSTKLRKPWIHHEIEDRVWRFLGGFAREVGMAPILVGGMPDHIHMAVGGHPTMAISKAIQQIKGGSSKWMREAFPEMKGFAWQDGYGAFSVSKSNLPALTTYIANQRKHHRKKTFKEEFVALLNRHGIDYDERYLWD
ncbi:transposase IS200-family protein [Chthoniobacter flavus Ellin428]|uniref:Transposase IS200-family protein n=1 Tax=Chthoniobacter flavus Ellin428 TaxID=497964 RepID=B4CVV0_9BACT|nr:IS200/IS605 family transposase [Chthoniobacter flavus]EDY21542.1 transposase IS200-family protein [Chthoniobacter flavus Ellin428]